MRTIQVKYLGPTNHRGSRMKAFADQTQSVTLPFDYARTPFLNARDAAEKLLARLSGGRVAAVGVLPNGDYVFTIHSN